MFLSGEEAKILSAVVEEQEKGWLQERVQRGNVQSYDLEVKQIETEVEEFIYNVQEGNLSNEEVYNYAKKWISYFKEKDPSRYERDFKTVDQIRRDALSEM